MAAETGDWRAALGWGEALEAAFAPWREKGLLPARVTMVYRKHLKVRSHRGEHWARIGGALLHRADPLGLPAVGDWVAARIPESGEALVHAVLPRHSAFVRKVAGDQAAPQVVAANVDVVLVVMGLDRDFSLRRLERFLTLAWESRAAPIVILNKTDLCEDLATDLAAVREVAGDVPVHPVCATADEGLEPVRALLAHGRTLVVLGSSGVGKSTLVNRLVGSDVMSTGELRDDGRGRHTTTRRELLPLPGGGAIIDTPGLREVQLWQAQGGLSRAFDDVEALARECRFTDCRHQAEPGCAVKAALDDGRLDDERFASWLELQEEVARLELPHELRGRPATKRRSRLGHGVRRK